MTLKGEEKLPIGVSDNFDMLFDLKVLLSLTYLMPLLNVVYCLIKFSQT